VETRHDAFAHGISYGVDGIWSHVKKWNDMVVKNSLWKKYAFAQVQH